jgi:anti-sigma factor RsiW
VTCREFADFMADYLCGELSAAVRARFDQHLGVCPNCEKYLAGYEATIKLGRTAFADLDSALPNDVPADLVEAILAARRS